MEILRAGSRPSTKGSAQWFTGEVRLDPLFNPFETERVQGTQVTFEPGARTAWHTHPLGQTLIVISGRGWAQREGGPVVEIRPGDVVSRRRSAQGRWIASRRRPDCCVPQPSVTAPGGEARHVRDGQEVRAQST